MNHFEKEREGGKKERRGARKGNGTLAGLPLGRIVLFIRPGYYPRTALLHRGSLGSRVKRPEAGASAANRRVGAALSARNKENRTDPEKMGGIQRFF